MLNKEKRFVMIEIEISSVVDYLEVIKQYKQADRIANQACEFLFRGQVVDSPLKPKILRLDPKTDLLATERLIFDEFKRTNPLLIDPFRAVDEWDFLTLGQHFGLPTRLLDWSDNALAALWFGTALDGEAANQCSVVWMLIASPSDYLQDKMQNPFQLETTLLYRPRIIKQRINNQSGVFSVHANSALLAQASLTDIGGYAEKLVKIEIPRNRISEIRDDLHTLGVHAFNIFPELEGLCTYLQWKFFK